MALSGSSHKIPLRPSGSTAPLRSNLCALTRLAAWYWLPPNLPPLGGGVRFPCPAGDGRMVGASRPRGEGQGVRACCLPQRMTTIPTSLCALRVLCAFAFCLFASLRSRTAVRLYCTLARLATRYHARSNTLKITFGKMPNASTPSAAIVNAAATPRDIGSGAVSTAGSMNITFSKRR